MADWPATLPQYLGIPLQIRHQEGTLRSDMDTGPAKQRKRFTAVAREYQTRMSLTGAELAIFHTFFETTLGHGAASFNWDDPITGAAASLRFVGRPTETMIRGDEDTDKREYILDMRLEQLP